MMTCKEIAEILSKSEADLSLMKKIELKFHLFMCKACGAYQKQLQSLAKGLRNAFESFISKNKQEIIELEDKTINQLSDND